MAYYKAHCDMPRTGFSPDASYPIINTEKGMLLVSLRSPYEKNGLVRSIRVGERHNVVPGEASAELNGGEELAAKALEVGEEAGLRGGCGCRMAIPSGCTRWARRATRPTPKRRRTRWASCC